MKASDCDSEDRGCKSHLAPLLMMMWPSGKALVCKTNIAGSNPVIIFRICLSRRFRLATSPFFCCFVICLKSFREKRLHVQKKGHLKNFCFSSVLKLCQTALFFANTRFVFCNRIQFKLISEMFFLDYFINSSISTGIITNKGIQLFICKPKIVFICFPA